MDTQQSFLLILCLKIFVTPLACAQEACDSNMECKLLDECPAVLISGLYPWQFKYCNKARGMVCCEKKEEQAAYAANADLTEISVKECLSYRDRAFPSCSVQPLIIGGKKAEPKEFPHMALLGVKSGDHEFSWKCGGALISPKFVLTAAHCFAGDEELNHVRLGELDYASTNDDAAPQDFVIRKSVLHPEYNAEFFYNDVALVELEGVAQFNEYVAPACLPLRNGSEFNDFLTAGWGAIKTASASSSHLLKVTLQRFSDDQCKKIIQSDSLTRGVDERTQICAGSFNDTRDTCTGDSGGPLFVQHPDYRCVFLLVGVTSFGLGCGVAGVPGVYARLNLYLDWIENVVWNATKNV